ncbi:MAG TPA: patatin-like phospholipase family protein [Kiloniellales bacterium]|nr:patatin-like phospholipase family protein [Kiloniellales bacterium]
MNKPLSEVAPADSPTISLGGYRLPALVKPEHDDLLLILAFSGGGKRSSAFSYGALAAMRELQVVGGAAPHSMLSDIDLISSVSGGTFTSMYYGLHREKLFTDYEDDFLRVDIDSYIYGIYLLPWNWDWLVNPLVGTNDYMAKVYDDHMFHGATYADLIKNGRPMIMADATDVTYGRVFSFIQDTFDLICSDLATFPLARATAASNGFPVLFSPITLISYTKDCKGRVPAWFAASKEAVEQDPDSRLAAAAKQAEEYLNDKETWYVHLLDGGIVDNLALRGLINSMLLMFDNPQAAVDRGFHKWRRVLVVSVDGEGDQDTSWARQRQVTGFGQILANVSGAQIDEYNFETLILAKEEVENFGTFLAKLRCAHEATIDGYRCDDVESSFVHLSLRDVTDESVRQRLEAIPTGLTVSEEDLKLLIESGRNAVMDSKEIRAALDVAAPTVAKQ